MEFRAGAHGTLMKHIFPWKMRDTIDVLVELSNLAFMNVTKTHVPEGTFLFTRKSMKRKRILTGAGSGLGEQDRWGVGGSTIARIEYPNRKSVRHVKWVGWKVASTML